MAAERRAQPGRSSRSARPLLALGLTLLALAGSAPEADAQGSAITFSAIGDVPYSDSELGTLEQHVADHNLYSPSQFFVHLGDILGSSEACVESQYAEVANALLDLAVPTFIIPGDNEWNDCSNPSQGWAFWEAYFSEFEANFCGTPIVEAQSVRPENFAFVQSGVLFVGINIVGGTVHSSSEWSLRLQQDADWVSQQLQAKKPQVRAAVIFGQAGPGQSKHDTFFDAFGPAAATFAKPILYLHGDGHSWIEDQPFAESNVFRVQVTRGTSPPVHVTVGTHPTSPFGFERDPWPGGTQPFNRAPCVEAVADLTLELGEPASLDAFVVDDGVPTSPGSVSTQWTQLSGPGVVTFADPSAVATTALFPDGGSYLLRLSASDGQLEGNDEVNVSVEANGPALSVDDVFVDEGQSALFTVRLLAAEGGSVQVDYATADGSSTAGSDFTAVSGQLSFSGTTVEHSVSVPVAADGLVEGTESFFLDLSGPLGAEIVKSRGVAVVLDGDSPTPPMIASFSPASGPLGTQVTVSGAGFSGATAVRFNGVLSASFVVDSDGSLRAVVPAAATTGPIQVTTPFGSDTSEASFTVRQPTLSVSVTGSGSVTVSPPGPSYAPGTVVTLTAVPASGSIFSGWSGDLAGSANPATLSMDADRSVTAGFAALPPGQVSLDVTSSGPGSVSGSPSGRVHPLGTVVTLTALPAPEHGFAGWSGDLSGSTNPAALTLDTHKVVTANFVPRYELNITSLGDGSVAASPPGSTHNEGTVVTLSAAPDPGWVFHGWSGDLGGSTNPASLAMTADRNVTATFKPPGLGVALQETRTGASTDAASVATSTALAAVPGQLYLAAVAMRPYRNTAAVSGLGLGWTELADQCSASNGTGVSLWWARGTPSPGPVTATLASAANDSLIVVSRYSGVDAANPIAVPPNLVRGNTNGVSGPCSGGSEGGAYALPLVNQGWGSVVHAAAATHRRSHDPGFGWTEQAEVQSGKGAHKAGLAVAHREFVAPGPAVVEGSFAGSAEWAVAAVEIRQQVYFLPQVTGFSPAFGLPGAQVTLTGTGFSGASLVRFGGVAASSFVVDSDTRIRASVPVGAASGPLSVTNPAGAGASGGSFFVGSPPSVSGFSPGSGVVGTLVSVSGSGFAGVTQVRFGGGVPGTNLAVLSDTSLRVDVPAGALDGPLSVVNPAGSATSSASFDVTLPACANGLDDDGDGQADFPADPGCESAQDLDERSSSLPCDDGADNDADGLVDFPSDPGCRDPSAASESPECDNDADDDGDGRVDWDGGSGGAESDPQCTAGWVASERTTRRCGLGFEAALVLLVIARVRLTRRS